jgi:preprotein translocase subunit SecA
LVNGFIRCKKINCAGNTKRRIPIVESTALYKNKALIKFLSEEESNNCFKKENQYMQDNKRDMHKIDEALYFVIEEKKSG